MKSFKKLTAFMLTAAMTLGVTGITALAADALPEAVKNVIILKEDVTLSNTYEIQKGSDITIDLAGHTITASSTAFAVNGKLTIRDSKGNGEINSSVKDSHAAIQVDGGAFVLESGTISANGKDGGGVYALNNGKVTINDGEISATSACLSGNNTTESAYFYVNGGELSTKEGPAIYMPGQGKIKIADGVLNGGIGARMGQITISGGVINGQEGSNIDSVGKYFDYSGNVWLGDAIFVMAGTYTSKTGDNSCNIKITGGEINGIHRNGIAVYNIGTGYDQETNIDISDDAVVTTGAKDYKAVKVYTPDEIAELAEKENKTYEPSKKSAPEIEITGGKFSDDVSEFVPENCGMVEKSGSFIVMDEDEYEDYLDSKKSHGSSYSLEEKKGGSKKPAKEEEEPVVDPKEDEEELIFVDVTKADPNYDAIMTVYEKGWMAGIGGNVFAPNGTLTRGMAAKILWNKAGCPEPTSVAPFLDVTGEAWYAKAVAWAYEQGIILGYDAFTFGPNDSLTMEQFEIMLAKSNGEAVPVYTGVSPYATRGWVAGAITK